MVQSVPAHLLIAAAAGGLLVTSVLPLNMIVLVAWVAIALATVNGSTIPPHPKPQLLLTQVFTFATVTLVALLAPIKTDNAHFSKLI